MSVVGNNNNDDHDLGPVAQLIMESEGNPKLPNGNSKLYRCPAGKWTFGYGWNVEDRGVPQDVVNYLLRLSIEESEREARQLVGESHWQALNRTRRDVLLELIFWMGLPTVRRFKNAIKAIRSRDWSTAADEMLDSRAGRQYRSRMSRLANSMRTGRQQNND